MSDMTLEQAASEAKKFGALVRALQKIDDVVDAALVAEQATQHAAEAKAALVADIEALQAQKEAEAVDLGKAVVEADAVIAKAKADAEDIVTKAKADAEALIRNAGVASAKIIDEAQTEAEEAKKRADKTKAAALDAEARASAAEETLANVRTTIAQLKGV